ncbi:MAG: GH3 auxin-responsive promoter family protein [Candidatus Peribacteria bacterium]|nr:MAG: GH3 auxin-responsive promoter family protein [Candidatus Peribacteria bacterium]
MIAAPEIAQQQTLQSLLKRAQHTTWGQFYGYKHINSYEQYAATVPISNYESIHHLVQRIYQGESNVMRPGKINTFAKTSGTTT